MSIMQNRTLWQGGSVQENTSSLRRYRLSDQARKKQVQAMWKLLGVSIMGGLVIAVVVVPLAMQILSNWIPIEEWQVAVIFAVLLLPPAVAAIGLTVGRAYWSFLEVSSDGLECRYWPGYHIRCDWNDVDRLMRAQGHIEGDVLLLKRADVLSSSLLLRIERLLFAPRAPYSIPLHLFAGWSDGEIMEDVCWYMPGLAKTR